MARYVNPKTFLMVESLCAYCTKIAGQRVWVGDQFSGQN